MAISTINQKGLAAPLALTSPVLTTPNLGTPSALVLTNATGTPAAINLTNATALPKAALPSGSVLQVVSTIKTDTTAFAGVGTWWNISGVSASITPASSSNKVLVTCVVTIGPTNTYNAVGGRMVRNGTVVAVGDTSGSRTSAFFGSDDSYSGYSNCGQIIISFLDSPASASSVAYNLQMINSRDNETVYINRSALDSSDSQQFRCVTTLTLMEVAG